MATRTWRGTTSTDWSVASNWLEGAVPLNGDDVVFDNQSGNCQLTSNVPSTGQLRSLIVSNDCTATIDINGKTLNLFNVGFDGVGFNAGSATWTDSVGNGRIALFLRASGTNPNFNRVIANNTTLQNINFALFNSSANLVLASNMYCKDLDASAVNNIHITPTTSVLYTLYVYGSLFASNVNQGSSLWGQISPLNINQNLVLQGNGLLSGGISIRSVSGALPTTTIAGNYTLNNHFVIYTQNNTNANAVVNVSGKVTAGSFDFQIMIFKTGFLLFGIDLTVNEVDRIILMPSVWGGRMYLRSLYVTKKLIVMSNAPYADAVQSAYGSGNRATVTLANEASLIALNTGFKDIEFNKPVTAIGGSATNCINLKIVDYPVILKNTF